MLTQLVGLLVAPQAACLAAGISPFGVCAHLGGGEEFSDRERELQLMQDAGIRWARADFTWGYFEPKDDQWQFGNYDTIVEAAKRHQVNLLPILCYNVDWAFPAHEHLDKWCDFVRTVVSRYKGDLKYWEVWNEPNIGFWQPEPNPEQYTALLKATYKTIKEVDPSLQVIYGGTAGIPWDFLKKTFELGACEAFDVLAVHPYRYPGTPEATDLSGDLQRTWDLLRENGAGDKKLWITEMGWPTHTNPAMGEGGAFVAALIRRSVELRFPGRETVSALALWDPGFAGSQAIAGQLQEALGELPGWTVQTVPLSDLGALDAQQAQVLIMPAGEWYAADYFARFLEFVREGGLLVHLGGVPLYYAARLVDGKWDAPFAGEGAREALHVGWKAWWTQQGLPEEAATTKPAYAEPALAVPSGVKTTRWLTDAKLRGNDRFVPLLEAYNGDQLIGNPAAVYLYDSDLKGGFCSLILGVHSSGVSDDQEAVVLPRAYLLTLAAGVECYLWYEFRDGGDDASYNEHRFGIIRHDMTPKPAYLAYQAMTRALGEGKFVERLDCGPGVTCLVFDTGQDKTVALWAAQGKRTLRLRVTGPQVKCTDYQCVPLTPPRQGDVLELEATETVTYVTGVEEVEVGR